MESREHDGCDRHGIGRGRQFSDECRCVATAGADVAAVTLGRVVGAGGACVRMGVCRVSRVVVSVTVAMRTMVCVTDLGRELARWARFCAEHGCSDRTTEGEQHAKHQQDEGAQYLHLGKLSRRMRSSDLPVSMEVMHERHLCRQWCVVDGPRRPRRGHRPVRCSSLRQAHKRGLVVPSRPGACAGRWSGVGW